MSDPFAARGRLTVGDSHYTIYRLAALEGHGAGAADLSALPYSLRILLESLLRGCGTGLVEPGQVLELAGWKPQAAGRPSLPYRPARVIMQDFTGVPAIVDLGAMRSAMARLGGDPARVNPQVAVDLVIDHSVQVDHFGTADSLARNAEIEFRRNRERYEFLHWGQNAFANFRVVPPATGIVHQVNLEYLAQVVMVAPDGTGGGPRGAGSVRATGGTGAANGAGATGGTGATGAVGGGGGLVAYPDTLVGTDSHTTMINGLGVLGWGVGGIEAEAALLGQPYDMVTPEVVGMRLSGSLQQGVTATDLTLAVVELLRGHGVVGKFVEFTGPGLNTMSLPDRATIANMAPEYGATVGFFPVDEETLRYLRLSGRPAATVNLVEAYCKEQGLFRSAGAPEPHYSELLELDMGTVEPALAGPKRPQDRVALPRVQQAFRASLAAPKSERGFELTAAQRQISARVAANGHGNGHGTANGHGSGNGHGTATSHGSAAGDDSATSHGSGNGTVIGHGAVVIAAITSCTNTSNPSVMLGAGILARKAVARGLTVPPYVKTSLAPGSTVVTDYLRRAEVLEPLAQLGFDLVGYGCTTCIGNSGPLPEAVARAVTESDLVVASVLSGNRNFEGRVHAQVKANYLASPPLVVAYALAGTVDRDLTSEPLGTGSDGRVGVPARHLAHRRRGRRRGQCHGPAGDVPPPLRQRARRQRRLERHRHRHGRYRRAGECRGHGPQCGWRVWRSRRPRCGGRSRKRWPGRSTWDSRRQTPRSVARCRSPLPPRLPAVRRLPALPSRLPAARCLPAAWRSAPPAPRGPATRPTACCTPGTPTPRTCGSRPSSPP